MKRSTNHWFRNWGGGGATSPSDKINLGLSLGRGRGPTIGFVNSSVCQIKHENEPSLSSHHSPGKLTVYRHTNTHRTIAITRLAGMPRDEKNCFEFSGQNPVKQSGKLKDSVHTYPTFKRKGRSSTTSFCNAVVSSAIQEPRARTDAKVITSRVCEIKLTTTARIPHKKLPKSWIYVATTQGKQ